jgi:hypothetical protein
MTTTIFQLINDEWETAEAGNGCSNPQLIICFGSKKRLAQKNIYELVHKKFPAANICMCSTAGEIYNNTVQDDSFIAISLAFQSTRVKTAAVNIRDHKNSFDAAFALVKKLPLQGLTNILVFSDGSMINGSELVKGLNDAVDNKILITGGLAGDGSEFISTLVGLNKQPSQGNVVAIGFYGDKLQVTHGSQGGWDMFGPEREVTRSEGNRLFEIDDKSALELYIKYLGPDADRLPGSALLFPLSVILPGSSEPVVRTILSIDKEQQTMTFAGDIPQGSMVRFMKANFDNITSAASAAAQHTRTGQVHDNVFSLLVSCVGRKLILGARIDEEVEAVQETLGLNTSVAGFYSYGEIAPSNEGGRCQLHNQTMTITSFYEHA